MKIYWDRVRFISNFVVDSKLNEIFAFFSLQVNHGSIADQAGLQPGDSVIAVNNVEAFNLRHKDAQDLIVRSGNSFTLAIQRGGSTWKPHVTPVGSMPSPNNNGYGGPVTRTSLQHYPPPNEEHIGCGYNNSARPFGQNGNVKSIVNKQYNTPVGMYSEESIAETLTAQAEVLANGVLGWAKRWRAPEIILKNSMIEKFLFFPTPLTQC